MTAWRVVAGAPVRVDDDPPAPGVDDVVIAVDAAWLAPAAVVAASAVVAGSAAVGAIVDAGEQARSLVGTRALIGPHLPCGECEVCRRGGAPVCPRGGVLGVDRRGTLADRITVPARWVVGFGPALDLPGPVAAVVAGDVAIAYAMYARASIGPREPAVVIGDDVSARFLAQILIAKGVTPVVIAGEGAAADRAAAIAGAAALGYAGKPWRLFATTVAAREVALALAGPRATIVARAFFGDGGGLALDASQLAAEIAVHAVIGAHPDLLVEVAALVVRGEVTLDGLVRVVTVDALAAALASPPRGQAIVVALR